MYFRIFSLRIPCAVGKPIGRIITTAQLKMVVGKRPATVDVTVLTFGSQQVRALSKSGTVCNLENGSCGNAIGHHGHILNICPNLMSTNVTTTVTPDTDFKQGPPPPISLFTPWTNSPTISSNACLNPTAARNKRWATTHYLMTERQGWATSCTEWPGLLNGSSWLFYF
jgi:hypothetical protein